MAETIADYIVRLGLHVDRAQEQRFNGALNNLGKTLATMAAGLAAAATAIQATVIAVSKSFDSLYFAAQRTNSTVAGIKSLSYAFSQIGGSADEAMSAISALAKLMRTNPEGMTKWLDLQGVQTKGKNTVQILMDAVDSFAKKDYRLGYQFAEKIGIPEDTWKRIVDNREQLKKFVKEYQEIQAKFGVDQGGTAKSSNEMMTAFRGLMAHLDALLTKVVTELQPQLTRILGDLAAWFEKNQDRIVRILTQIVAAVNGLIEDLVALAKALQPVVDAFMSMVEAISGRSGLQVAMEALLIFMAGAWLKGMLATFSALMAHPAFAVLAAIAAGGTIIYKGLTTSNEDKAALGDALDNSTWGKRALGWMDRNIWGPLGVSPNKGGATGAAPDGLAPIRTKSGKTAMVAKQHQAQFQGFINDLEATGYEIKDLGGFANRANANNPGQMSKHAHGMAVDINPGSNPNRSTQTDLPPNTADLAKKWGLGWGMNWKSVKDPMHFSTAPNEGGRTLSPDELKQLQDEQAQRLKDKQSELFGAPPLGAPQGRMASLSNRTNITIYGSTDPAGTAANLGGAQNRIAAELIRNTTSAFV